MSIQIIDGENTTNSVNVNNNYQLHIATEKDSDNKKIYIGSLKMFSENVAGDYIGSPILLSPETDDDYRLRISKDTLLDDELFNYAAQNTYKHTVIAAATNLVPSWTTGGYNTNPTSIVTTTSGATLQTYAQFGVIGSTTLSLDMELSFTALPVSNSIIDFGFFLGATTNPFAPTDGVYFRLNSGGLQGIINYGGSELSTGVFKLSSGDRWIYELNRKYQYILYVAITAVYFWLDGELLGKIETPSGQGTPYLSAALPFRIRHAIVGGAASGPLNCIMTRYNIRMGGGFGGTRLDGTSPRIFGSYQGLSGGTLGSLQFGTVTTGSIVAPTAAVITNTTAALGTGLGGTFYETPSVALNTDAIIDSYQVPAGSTVVQGRRLVVSGVSIQSFVQTAIAGGTYSSRFYISFGNTAVSLATAESSTTKAPRRIMTPILQKVGVSAVSTIVTQNIGSFKFTDKIYINPGEFIALVKTNIGPNVGTTGTIAHIVVWDYTWE